MSDEKVIHLTKSEFHKYLSDAHTEGSKAAFDVLAGVIAELRAKCDAALAPEPTADVAGAQRGGEGA